MIDLDDNERQQLQASVRRREQFEFERWLTPRHFYHAHSDGQLQFHQAEQIIRALWPGNGFGKTRAAGTEVAWWVFHDHPYQKTPAWPVTIIWCAETYKQFDILREQLESECFGPKRSRVAPAGWKWNEQKKQYTFPDGSKLFLISGDSDWKHIQGINPDLIVFDEEPPKKLWNELRMRRRGRRKTRFIFAATATQGLTWMYHELFKPWLEFHTQRNCTFEQAIARQLKPDIWAWPRGGIDSNPGADAGDRAYYHSQTFSSEAEKRVRMFGGFADFSGLPVFDLQALERMRARLMPGQSGTLTPIKRDDGTEVLGAYEFIADGEDERGRVTIFEHPDLEKCRYVIGHDSAYGLVTGDFDYAVVLNLNTGQQVAEAQGHWGDVGWAHVLAGLYHYYGQAFMCGERQVGLMVMRRLYDEMGIGFQFFNRDEAKRAKRRSDTLGHHRRAGDLVIRNLRKALGARDARGQLLIPEIIILSQELHRQACAYQFSPKRKTIDVYDAQDAELQTGAPEGDHDDGVMGLAYARMAMNEVAKFEPPAPVYKPGTYGETFQMAADFNPPKQKPVNPYDPETV